MTNIIDLMLSQSEWVSSLAISLGAFIVLLRIYLNYKKHVISRESKESEVRASITTESFDNLSHLLIQNFKTLDSFYSESLSQYRTSSIASIAVAVLGFVVIISGVLLALLSKQVAIGTVSSAAGIVGEAAALLFFKQTRTFQTQMESSLEKLVSSQYLMTSVALAREMEEKEKSQELSKINDHLRSLMDLLHGKKAA